MASPEHSWVLCSLVLIGVSLMSCRCSLDVDTSKVTLGGDFYTLFGCARDLNVPDSLMYLYKNRIYPDDQLTCCVFRCLGIRLGIYDDINGLNVDKQYERLKSQLSVDEDTYKRGVRNCIRNLLRGRTLNDCERAFLILRRCQGDTITSNLDKQLNEIRSASFTPSSGSLGLDTSKVSLDGTFVTLFGCARDLNVPDSLIALYKERIYPDDQLTCCVFRCIGQRLGIYDDINGLDVDKQYERVKDRLSVDEDTYKRGVRNCIRNVLRGRTLNDCERAFLIMRRCQGDTITNSLNERLSELRNCGSSLDTSKVSLRGTFFTLFGCARDLNVPDSLIALYKKCVFPNDQLTCCVFRCLGIRLGIYDDINGLNVDKQYERLKNRLSVDEVTYKRGVRNCIRNVLRDRTLNSCERAFLIIRRCQGDTIPRSLNAQLRELGTCAEVC
uniref:Uncharacterized protein n=1 Tax=Anopheles epiroticus TaxID=199890 RepID=A0A182PD50_9DIPT